MNPHECSQTWQVVRSEFDEMMLDNAAEQGATVWQEANVTDVILEPTETDDLPAATRRDRRSARARRRAASTRRSSWTPPAPTRCSPRSSASASATRSSARRRSSPTTRAAGATRARTTARRSCSPPRATTAGSGTSRCRDDIISVGVVGEVDRLVGQDRRHARADRWTRRSPTAPAWKTGWPRPTRVRPGPRPVRLLLPRHAAAPARAGCWSATPSASSTRCIPPACSSPSRAARWPPTRSTRRFEKNDFSAAQLGKWGDPAQPRGCRPSASWSTPSTPRASRFGQFIKTYPQHRDDVTAVLIGDVFRPGVDDVFEPMSTMAPIPESIPLEKPKARARGEVRRPTPPPTPGRRRNDGGTTA